MLALLELRPWTGFGNLSRCILEWCELADEEMSRWEAIDDPGRLLARQSSSQTFSPKPAN